MDKKQLIESLKENFDEKIIKAFSRVKREDFVSKSLKELAYEDIPLPIGQGQTISQPYTIAFMLNLLDLKDNLDILEIGSGSGYVLALINEISKNSKIIGFERIKQLAENSKKVLKKYKNIKIINKNGFKGIPNKKFDRILISASASKIPEHLYSQLNDNGIIVACVQNSIFQIKKNKNKIEIKEFPGFIFVPLVEGE